MTIIKKHTSFGELLRSLREDAGQTLKTVAENLEMDTSLLAKIERNERQPTKNQIKLLAQIFNEDEKILFAEYLSDQIAYNLLKEGCDVAILKTVQRKINYLQKNKNNDR